MSDHDGEDASGALRGGADDSRCDGEKTPPAHAGTSATVRGWRHAGAAYEVSWTTSARSAWRKSCRAVSRSTMRIGAPQRGHGHGGRGMEAASGSFGGVGATARA